MKVVLPMAGLGSRFTSAGFSDPKPLIDVAGKPMIERVLRNLAVVDASFVLIAQHSHYERYRLVFDTLIEDFSAELVLIDGITEGTACTVLAASASIDGGEILIANSDQYIDQSVQSFIDDARGRNLQGSIMCFRDQERNPKWSFAEIDSHGYVVRVKEKEAISDLATVGLYYFRSGYEFLAGAREMIDRLDTVNGEYYTCPVYNYLIQNGSAIGVYEIDQADMWGLGTPDDLKTFLANTMALKIPLSKEA